jgi:hypothetical protein
MVDKVIAFGSKEREVCFDDATKASTILLDVRIRARTRARALLNPLSRIRKCGTDINTGILCGNDSIVKTYRKTQHLCIRIV